MRVYTAGGGGDKAPAGWAGWGGAGVPPPPTNNNTASNPPPTPERFVGAGQAGLIPSLHFGARHPGHQSPRHAAQAQGRPGAATPSRPGTATPSRPGTATPSRPGAATPCRPGAATPCLPRSGLRSAGPRPHFSITPGRKFSTNTSTRSDSLQAPQQAPHTVPPRVQRASGPIRIALGCWYTSNVAAGRGPPLVVAGSCAQPVLPGPCAAGGVCGACEGAHRLTMSLPSGL